MSNPLDWYPGATQSEDDRNPIEQNDEMLKAAEMARLAHAKLFYDLFASPLGSHVLNLLRDRTIEVPLMNFSSSIEDSREISVNPGEWAYWRDGQNSVVRFIEKQIQLVANHAQASQQEQEANVSKSKTTRNSSRNKKS